METVTFSDGLSLPKDSHIELPIVPIQHDFTENPEVFDGYRSYKLRQKPEDAHKHQFTSTSLHSLHFGHKQHSCPGRFMASNVIKMVLGSLLVEYYLRWPGERHARPRGIHAFEYNFPNPFACVEMRKRHT